jgi:branched-chain amino acid transport system permease protein
MNTTVLLQNTLNGLAIGGIYAIFALGYTLIFSILRIVNFAHAAIFTLGAYFTYTLTGSRFRFNGLLANQALPFGLPFPLALLLGAMLAGLVSVAIEQVAFRPLRARGTDPLLSLVSSLGVAIVIVNLIQYLVGAENFSYPNDALGDLPAAINFGTPTQAVPVRTVQIIIFAVSLAIVVALTLLINRTRVGKALQAVAEDATTASLLGINTDRLIMLTFFLSGFLGGVAGTLVGLSVCL